MANASVVGLDHVVVVAQDLQAAAGAWRQVSLRGHMTAIATRPSASPPSRYQRALAVPRKSFQTAPDATEAATAIATARE